MDGAMVVAAVRNQVQSTADSQGQQTQKRTLSRAFARDQSAVSSPSIYRGVVSLLVRNQQLAASVVGSGGGGGASVGYGWIVYDSNRYVYYANSDFTSFTLKGGPTSSMTFTYMGTFLRQGTASVDEWYTSGVTNGKISKSTDGGVTWTAIASLTDANSYKFTDLYIQSPTTLFASSARNVYRSTNGGTTWTRLIDTSPGFSLTGMLLRNNTLILYGANNIFYTSTDGGSTFTNHLLTQAFTSQGLTTTTTMLRNMLYFNNTFWAIGFTMGVTKTFILTSSDGLSWTITTLSEQWSPRHVVRNPVTGLLVAQAGLPRTAGSAGIRWSADNGLTWTDGTGSVAGTSSNSPEGGISVNSLHFDGIRYVVYLYNNGAEGIHTSTDGKVWTALTTRTPSNGTVLGVGIRYIDPTKQLA